ncbi:MAG: glycosyltransferase family 2 protein, partial [Verrucomicrobiota bacterium]
MSICIPTYNRAPYLEALLEELSRQIEEDGVDVADVAFYIADNHSTDETPAVLERFKERGYRTEVVRNPANLGINGNLLKICRMARGRYWWLLGDDELVNQRGLVHLLALVEREAPGLIIAFDTLFELKLKRRGRFEDYHDFARTCCEDHPAALTEHTLLSSNIFSAADYDHAAAEAYKDTYFPHMYGMLKPLIENGGAVVLPDFPLITTRKQRPPPADDQGWINLDAYWADYLKSLKDMLSMPELDPHAPSRSARSD